MTKKVQDEAPARSAEAQAWIDENVAEQQVRYEGIVKEMDELAPTRAKWYEEFLHIVQTKGFSADGDRRVVIKPENVPQKPDRPDRVVF